MPRTTVGVCRPREMLLSGQSDAVSDAGLISVLMGEDDEGWGSALLREYSAPDGLWRLGAEELVAMPGVGPAAAARFLAGLEMSRRASGWKRGKRTTVSTPEDVVAICWPPLRGMTREHFWALALSTRNHLLKTIEVSVGSLNASIVHPRELFKEAVKVSAASVVIVHNHPSGDSTPSGADIQLTRRLIKAGDVLGIEVLDHVVIGDGGDHSSMREAGLM